MNFFWKGRQLLGRMNDVRKFLHPSGEIVLERMRQRKCRCTIIWFCSNWWSIPIIFFRPILRNWNWLSVIRWCRYFVKNPAVPPNELHAGTLKVSVLDSHYTFGVICCRDVWFERLRRIEDSTTASGLCSWFEFGELSSAIQSSQFAIPKSFWFQSGFTFSLILDLPRLRHTEFDP